MYKELSLFMGINVNGFRELPPPPQETSVFLVSSEGLPQRTLGIAEANPSSKSTYLIEIIKNMIYCFNHWSLDLFCYWTCEYYDRECILTKQSRKL